MRWYERHDFEVLSAYGYLVYLILMSTGSIIASFVLRWSTGDSYDLPAFKNKKRLHFVSSLSDADSTTFYRIRDVDVKKK